jgi:hypothetical protein
MLKIILEWMLHCLRRYDMGSQRTNAFLMSICRFYPVAGIIFSVYPAQISEKECSYTRKTGTVNYLQLPYLQGSDSAPPPSHQAGRVNTLVLCYFSVTATAEYIE